MTKEHKEIINLISRYLESNPYQRFGQALFNLDINEFKNKKDPDMENYNLRDIYNDQDKAIIERIKPNILNLTNQ